MQPNLVSVAEALTPGINTRFISTYAREVEGSRERISRVMDLAIPSDGAWNVYHHYKSAPHVRRLDRGSPIEGRGFGGVGWTTANLSWGRSVEAHQDDLEDDRTKNLENRAADLGTSFALLPERVFFQFATGATNPDLVQTIPNAPDGVGMFSATDGDGNARYGRTGGNLATGSGVASAQAITDDFFTAITGFRQFKDTESVAPLFGEDFTKQGFVISFNVANYQQFLAAFEQARTVYVVKNVAATENVAGVAPTNLIMTAGVPVYLNPTIYITDNDWFVSAIGAPVKPVYQQYRRGIEMHPQTRDNSDIGRRDKIYGWFYDSREGYGVNECFGIFKVNN